MPTIRLIHILTLFGLLLSACANSPGRTAQNATNINISQSTRETRETIWNLFRQKRDPNINVAVNKYIWQASLDVLSFLPLEELEPFTGVIVTGYGKPPGGSTAYRATIYVRDAALEARSLSVTLNTRSGKTVDTKTTKAVEDAILTRARALRVASLTL